MFQGSRARVAFPEVPAPTLGGSKPVTSDPMEFSSALYGYLHTHTHTHTHTYTYTLLKSFLKTCRFLELEI